MDVTAANAVADALEALALSIRTHTALPGESSKTTAPKSKPATRKPRRRSAKPKASPKAAKSSTTRKESAKPKAARTPRKVESVAVAEPGNLNIITSPKGKAKPSAKQTVRRRYEVHYVNAEGVSIRHRTRFRMFRKAEAAADLLRNRGVDVTITPVNVAFKRKSKTTRQARTAAKAAAAKAA